MASPICDRAIEDAQKYGDAILKFISPNDVDQTGGHQYGYYLPKAAWQIFTPRVPKKGVNYDDPVKVLWQDGRVTNSRLHWYGQKTRNEHRLTSFQRDFPFRTFDNVGDLLVLIPVDFDNFIAYVLYEEEDIEDICAALGLETFQGWAAYEAGAVYEPETEDECVERNFKKFIDPLTEFPSGDIFSETAIKILVDCIKKFPKWSPDDRIMESLGTEYRLFKRLERKICEPDITRLFKDVDDFVKSALTILQRRKSRAGRSLENHVEYILKQAGVPHVMRPDSVDGEPDVVIPSAEAYHDRKFPDDKLAVIGIKTTCKDRWRQVLNEGTRIEPKYIMTTQPGISTKQLKAMHKAKVTLVVPERLHKDYPVKDSGIKLLNLDRFIDEMKRRLV